jgi:hypothetical protein
MKKSTFIILLVVLVLVCIGIGVLVLEYSARVEYLKMNPVYIYDTPTPTTFMKRVPTPEAVENFRPRRLLSSSPADGDSDVSLQPSITLRFNKNFLSDPEKEYIISFSPDVKYKLLRSSADTVVLTVVQPLDPFTRYLMKVNPIETLPQDIYFSTGQK